MPSRLPDNHEDFGRVHDPVPVDDGLPVEIDDRVTSHICRVEDGQPLCDVTVDDHPVYPFTGLRAGIEAGLDDCCPECVDALERVAADEDKTSEVVADGAGRCWDYEDCPCEDCDGNLQQQDRYNVHCRTCERVWTHVKPGNGSHQLQTADGETVGKKPVKMADGADVAPKNIDIEGPDHEQR